MTIATLIKENDRTFRDKKFLVIGDNGEQLGILDFSTALAKAKAAGLDLVVVAEKADPLVARFMDYGKLVFEQKKREKDQKRKNSTQKVKEVKFSLRISPNDFEFKLHHAFEFLAKGYKVKITIQFMGRELAHKEIGFELFKRIELALKPFALADSQPKLLGKTITVAFTAIKGAKFEEILKDHEDFDFDDDDDENDDDETSEDENDLDNDSEDDSDEESEK